ALPALKNLRVVGGPSVSQQISFVNGAMSQSRAYTYVLQPTAVGKAEIGALQVKLASGVKTTAPISIDVVSGSLGGRPGRGRGDLEGWGGAPFGSFFGRRRPAAEPKLKVVAAASRPKVHVGEPVLVTFFLYTQASITDIQLADAPQFAGFWAEDVEAPKG